MRRLIFYYTMNGSCGDPSKEQYDPTVETKNHFAVASGGIKSEGYLLLLQTLLARSVIDEVVIFIESTRSPGSTRIENITVHVVPHIEHSRQFLQKGDIIWIRGGFRGWHNFLASIKGTYWLMLYAANTGRERWPFWDVILDDLGKTRLDALGRFFYDFYKPIPPELFYYDPQFPKYDICIGASHIHEKKAQYKVVDAVCSYRTLFGDNLRCVLPGRYIGSFGRDLPSRIKEEGLNIEMPGMVTRHQLNKIFNQTCMTVFMTQGGQGDRGPMESLSSGTPVIIRNPKRHHYSIQRPDVCKVATSSEPEYVARLIREAQFAAGPAVAEYFKSECGFYSQAYPRFVKLLDCMIGKQPSMEHLKCLL